MACYASNLLVVPFERSLAFVAAATGQSVGQPFPSPIAAYGASRSNPDTAVDWSKYLPVTDVPSFYYQNVSPYSESYTLSIERELAPNTIVRTSPHGLGPMWIAVPSLQWTRTTCSSPVSPALQVGVLQPVRHHQLVAQIVLILQATISRVEMPGALSVG